MIYFNSIPGMQWVQLCSIHQLGPRQLRLKSLHAQKSKLSQQLSKQQGLHLDFHGEKFQHIATQGKINENLYFFLLFYLLKTLFRLRVGKSRWFWTSSTYSGQVPARQKIISMLERSVNTQRSGFADPRFQITLIHWNPRRVKSSLNFTQTNQPEKVDSKLDSLVRYI